MTKSFAELTLDDVMKALPNGVEGKPGRFLYNLEFMNPDGTRVPQEKYWVLLDEGKASSGEGHKDDPDACAFQILQGGLDTVIAFQVYGMKAATSAMMMGYVFTDNLKKAEAWFKMLKIGKKEFLDALGVAGIEIGDTSLPIFSDLMLE